MENNIDFNVKNVFHSSSNNFDEFKLSNFDYFFFSDKPIKVEPKSNILYKCNLSIHNPIIFDCNSSWSYPLWLYLTDKNGELIHQEQLTKENYDNYLGLPFQVWEYIYNTPDEDSVDELPQIIKYLNIPCDSIIIKNIDEGIYSTNVTDYIVFNPNQIQIISKSIF